MSSHLRTPRPTALRRGPGTVAAGLLLLVAGLAGCGDGGGARPSAGGSPLPTPGITSAGGTLFASGDNSLGQLAVSDRLRELTLHQVRGRSGADALTDVVATAGGGRHSLAVLADGRVFAWGANDRGQLGDGSTTPAARPVAVSAPDGGAGVLRGAVAVAADTDFSMALLTDGTVVTWGSGDAGQRGIGARPAPLTPTRVRAPDGNGPLRGVRGIAADGRTELALLADGSVVSWGAGGDGQLGDGTTEDRSLPAPVVGVAGEGLLAGVTQVAVGGQHGLALLDTGRVVSWGGNDQSQLGDGTSTGRSTPGYVAGPGGKGVLGGISQIAAAEKFNLALHRDGTLVAWGANAAGQLGDGTTTQRSAPVPVTDPGGEGTLGGVRLALAGEAYAVAVTTEGAAFAWGANSNGQLARGDTRPRRSPEPMVLDGVPVTGVLTAGVGERHVLVAVRR